MILTAKFIIIFIIVQRSLELLYSSLNKKKLLEIGAVSPFEFNYYLMVLFHIAWIGYYFYFIFYQLNTLDAFRFNCGLVLFIIGQILRIIAIYHLGDRWTTEVVILRNGPLIKHGIYRYIRHPNYCGVFLEIIALPVMFSQFFAIVIFTFLHSIILILRIRFEEKLLFKCAHETPPN